ncbi:MAG TPA: hypothetical protein VGG75_38695 [Trebonia sp.]|jgi:hypothetical protein
MRRTWFRPSSGRAPFRNCQLITEDMERLENKLPWRQSVLHREWEQAFRRGVMQPGSEYNPAEPGPHDRFIPFDDSPEANDRWAGNLIAEYKARKELG